MESVFIAPVFDGAVLGKGVGVEAATLHGQRVIDDELHRHHWVHFRRVAALIRNGVAQAC